MQIFKNITKNNTKKIIQTMKKNTLTVKKNNYEIRVFKDTHLPLSRDSRLGRGRGKVGDV